MVNNKVVTDDVDLSHEQEQLFKLLESTDRSFFITGQAGTGKSVLLKYFVENTAKNVAVVAPTGVAALNVEGATIHSFFKLKPTLQELGSIKKVESSIQELLEELDVLVIDEVSMVSADLMEAVSQKLKLARGDDSAFGGVQVALFGDLYQLPPVISDEHVRQYLDHTFGGAYFFNSFAYQSGDIETYELQQIFRQKDQDFKDILNQIRTGTLSYDALNILNERSYASKPSDGYVVLAGTNRVVNYLNQHRLSQLDTEERTYIAATSGNMSQSAMPTEQHLTLKVGAQVMILRNDFMTPRRWVNGTLATVVELGDKGVKVDIDGATHTLSPVAWEKIAYEYDRSTRKLNKKVVSSFKQLPLKLAWASTVHKSQGKTFESAVIDMSRGAFAHGQTYVALSRCTSLDGLYLESPISMSDIIVDPKISSFMQLSQG